MSAAEKRMQVALANLRLWMALIGNDEKPSIHPERVIEAIGALEVGLAAIRGEPVPEEEQEVVLVGMEEGEIPIIDEEALIAAIQEQAMKQGLALPADLIAMVLEAEEDYLYNRGVISVDFLPDDDSDEEEGQ